MDKEIKELLESSGLENANEITEKLSQVIEERFKQIEDENEAKLTERLTRLKEEADEVSQAELELYKEKMELWHKSILQTELNEVNNQLLIAKDIRQVRSGMEKMIEGMKEAGIDTTQLFENVAAAEVIELQERIEEQENTIAHLEEMMKSFQRAWIVEQLSHDLTMIERDAIIDAADNIDENIAPERFMSIVEMLVSDKIKSRQDNKKENAPLDENVQVRKWNNEKPILNNVGNNKDSDIAKWFLN